MGAWRLLCRGVLGCTFLLASSLLMASAQGAHGSRAEGGKSPLPVVVLEGDEALEFQKSFNERLAKLASAGPPDWPAGIDPPKLGTGAFKPPPAVRWPETPLLGDTGKLEAARAGWTVVALWASWCAPCIEELPYLQTADAALQGHGVSIVPINIDLTGRDTPKKVRRIFAKRKVTAFDPLVAAPEEAAAALADFGLERGTSMYPMTVIFAPGGEPVAMFTGTPISGEAASWKSEDMVGFLKALGASSDE
jgi:thiol-disulfide isomerase/thioredoxin